MMSASGHRPLPPIALASDLGRLAPYLAATSDGNLMIAERRRQAEAAAALGRGIGSSWQQPGTRRACSGSGSGRGGCDSGAALALAVTPAAAQLAPHSSMALELVAFAGLPGTFCDTLNVQVCWREITQQCFRQVKAQLRPFLLMVPQGW
jgi:hypothetical protein